MKFHKVQVPHEERIHYCHGMWKSECLVWTIRIDRVMFGYRVHVQHFTNHLIYHTDLCAGDDPDWQIALFYVVMKYLEKFVEDEKPHDIFRDFPTITSVKPIWNATKEWEVMCQMSGLSSTDVYEISKWGQLEGVEAPLAIVPMDIFNAR